MIEGSRRQFLSAASGVMNLVPVRRCNERCSCNMRPGASMIGDACAAEPWDGMPVIVVNARTSSTCWS